MTQEHPQAAILRAIANGKQMQRQCNGSWYDVTAKNALYRISQGMTVRIKPETIVINGVECPKPIAVTATEGYAVKVVSGTRAYWTVFATQSDADKVFDALCEPFKEAV